MICDRKNTAKLFAIAAPVALSLAVIACPTRLAYAAETKRATQASHAAPHAHPPIKAARIAAQDFDATSWASLLQSGPRPAAYLFTTTYCSSCAAVFQEIAAAAKLAKPKPSPNAPALSSKPPELIVVIMDADPQEAEQHASHFQGLTQLYRFAGHEAAIRARIDPQWRNITPYVVLIDRQGARQTNLGSPSPAALQRWLQ